MNSTRHFMVKALKKLVENLNNKGAFYEEDITFACSKNYDAGSPAYYYYIYLTIYRNIF